MTLTTMQQRRGTAAAWTLADPTLAAGEIGVESDTGLFKIGDGATAWTSLGYANQSAPIGADYLVGTAQAGLSSEIVVGTTPGGELGGTWSAPTVDAVHSGSSHAATQAAAEATAAAALSAHETDPTAAHAASAISNTPAGGIAATDVQAALNELDGDKPATADVVLKSAYDANTILKADSDDTPAALTMGASTILARLAAGSIVAATPSEIRTLLALVIGTNVQAWDADLDAIAALSPSNDDILQRKSGAWTNRTIAQLLADLAASGTTFQPLDADLTAIAALATQAFGRSVLEAATAKALRGLAGYSASARTSTVAIANTETVVISYTCDANELAAGTTFRFAAACTQAGTNAATPTIRIRVGTTTLTGNIAATLTGNVGGSAVSSVIDGEVTVRSAGAGGTIIGWLRQTKSGVTQVVNAQTGTVAVDTTAANVLIELTFISGNAANTYTFQEATVRKIAG